MESISITGGQLLWILGAIAALSAAWRIISQPFKRLDQHDREIAELKKAVANNGENTKTILTALNSIVNHMIDGNGIDGLKKARDALQKDLIEKQ